MKSLIIAEKPSVAADLAKALGKIPKKGDHYENDEYVISSAVGHLVELLMPEDIDKKKYGFWRLEMLPIIPEKFQLKPIEQSKDRYNQLKKLLARKDIDLVINACDAGREGELIFAYLYQLTKSKLPVKRAWMQTMTNEGIKEAFLHLRDGEQMKGLADAARCRSESAWLIGINGTRALTKRMFGSRAGNVASVGRVQQTPYTLAIVYARELEDPEFQAAPVLARDRLLPGREGRLRRRLSAPEFQALGKRRARSHRSHLGRKKVADAVHAACQGLQPLANVTEEKKASTSAAPRLYDLTTAAARGEQQPLWPARPPHPPSGPGAVRAAQGDHLSAYRFARPAGGLHSHLPRDIEQPAGRSRRPRAQKVLAEGWLRPNKRIFNNAKISDHFAIIPTAHDAKHLDEMEAKVYDMIARRFIAAFLSGGGIRHHHADQHGRGTRFQDRGARCSPSRSCSSPSTVKTPSTMTPPTQGAARAHAGRWYARQGENCRIKIARGDHEAASPLHPRPRCCPPWKAPANWSRTRNTCCGGHEGARPGHASHARRHHRRTHQPEVHGPRPARTRPFNEGRAVDPVSRRRESGRADAAHDDWRMGKLRQNLEHGKFPRPKFMDEVVEQTKGIIERVKAFEEDDSVARITDIPSPTDGKPLRETLRGYRSQDGEFMFYKVIGGRKMEESEVRELVEKRTIEEPLDGFISAKTRNRFAAVLRLVRDEEKQKWKTEFDFGDKFDLATLTPFWTDPTSGAQLCEAGSSYVLRERDGDGWKQTFRVGRLMCQKAIPQEEAVKLVSTGKTDLIKGFTSKKGRPFDAFTQARRWQDLVGVSAARTETRQGRQAHPPENQGAAGSFPSDCHRRKQDARRGNPADTRRLLCPQTVAG